MIESRMKNKSCIVKIFQCMYLIHSYICQMTFCNSIVPVRFGEICSRSEKGKEVLERGRERMMTNQRMMLACLVPIEKESFFRI